MADVCFENVNKIYANGHPALTDLNLAIQDGEFMVIVGPSGCGKSTLLRVIAGLEPVSSGFVSIGGEVVNRLTPKERNIAMVFQDYALYPNMTVKGNLEFPLVMSRTPAYERTRRITRIAETLALGDVLDRLPKELSGGQKQRVAMGRALIREPAVFLLDEPLSNLDAKLRTQVRAEIAELQKRMGTTMIYVTHDQVEAMTMGQRIAVLERGRLQQVGTPEAIYADPRNPFVAGFLGTPPMNLYTSVLVSDDKGQPAVRWGDQTITVDPMKIPGDSSQEIRVVTWGVRPESVHLGAVATLTGHVCAAEYLGHETLLFVTPSPEAEGAMITLRQKGSHAGLAGKTIALHIAPEDIFVFLKREQSPIQT